MSNATEKKISLYCTEGSSDKVYTLWIEEKDGLYMVESQGGRRGGPMQHWTKTPKPVSLEKAEATYEKTLKEKLAKGYHEGEDAPAYSHPGARTDGGYRSMLLTQVDEEEIETYLSDDSWGAQEKLNGKHIMAEIQDGFVTGYNKAGLQCPIPVVVQKALESFKKNKHVLDGELVGEIYHVFDVIESASFKDDMPYSARAEAAMYLAGFPKSPNVRGVPLAVGREAKKALLAALRKGKKEGITFKKLAALRSPGKTENVKKAVAVKVKFYKEMDCVVISWTGKSSIEVGAYEGDIGSALVSIGKVTVPAKYVKQVKIGGVARVRYLYGTKPGRQLFQANLDPDDAGIFMRDDVLAKDCLMSAMQFEGKDE